MADARLANASCEKVLFSEKDHVMSMLKDMAAPDCPSPEGERLLNEVTAALVKYLEQPHLLDPHLGDMMDVVMGRANELIIEREETICRDSRGGDRRHPGQTFPFQVFTSPQLQSMFGVVYQLCRVRGSKAVVRLMPHEAAQLEPVIHALQSQDPDDFSTWETRYGLLLWLAMLSLVPFDIMSIDSGLVESNSIEGGSAAYQGAGEGLMPEEDARQNDLIGTILTLGMKHLGDAGPTRDAAAACLSSLLTRPDMEAAHLRRFLEWSASVLQRVTEESREGREGLNKLAFLVMGVMATLASLFKKGHRAKLIDLIPVIFDPVVGLAELGYGQTLLRKMLAKLLQRIGTTYVPPRVISWRYQRGQRSLLQAKKKFEDSFVTIQNVATVFVVDRCQRNFNWLLSACLDAAKSPQWLRFNRKGGKRYDRVQAVQPCNPATGVCLVEGTALSISRYADYKNTVDDCAWERPNESFPVVRPSAPSLNPLAPAKSLGAAPPQVASDFDSRERNGDDREETRVAHSAGRTGGRLAAGNAVARAGEHEPERKSRQTRGCARDPEGHAGANVAPGADADADADADANVDIPEELEEIVDALLCGLRDRDTVVRWSAAKGIGRITERLPHELADDVVCSVLDLFVEAEWEGAWHGGCLALAELARRGLLLPERLPRACPLVERALAYDVRRGSSSVGAHVRDAACYVCWAFARAYAPRVLGRHLPGLCDCMLSTALFDREVNVRRAAAAAFQENVGRQGQYGEEKESDTAAEQGVAHGIAVITAADYFTLGNRQQAYLEIATTIASLERYRSPLVETLRTRKLDHWDPEIRALAAQALGRMTPLDPTYAANTILPAALADALSPDLLKRHGACLALSEVTLALGKVSHDLSSNVMDELVGIVPALEKARLYRGRGGELMRQAACRLVECLAITRADVTVKAQLRFLNTIDESVRHPLERVQVSASAALRAVLGNWFPVGDAGPSERLQTRTIQKYVKGLRTEENAAAARGYALALGALPRKLAGASRDILAQVLDALKDAIVGRHGSRVPPSPLTPPPGEGLGGGFGDRRSGSFCDNGAVNGQSDAGMKASGRSVVAGYGEAIVGGPGGEPDAETRRNAIRALAALCKEVGVGEGLGAGGIRTHAAEAASESKDEAGRASWRPVGLTLSDVESVLCSFLAAANDYSVDNRGDVGSWCRMEALTGLEKLLRLAARASLALPLANRGIQEEEADTEVFWIPSLEERLPLLDRPPAPVPSRHPCDEVYITPSMVERAMCAVLKQLSEKLDAVREHAGRVLESVIRRQDPQLPFVPEMAALRHAVDASAAAVGGRTEHEGKGAADAPATINWGSSSATFPIVVGLLAVREYHEAIVAGLVISMGGLTESVVTHSSKAMLSWVRACKSTGNKRAVAGLAMRLVGMFDKARGNARVVIPLLKTVETLLSNECFDSLTAGDHAFAEALLSAVTAEMRGCKDVKKLCLGASVYVAMLDYGEPARPRALRNSVLCLGHRFPRVRTTVSEALYVKLVANDDIVHEDVYDEVLDLLTCTPWDGDLGAAKTARSELAALLSTSLPTAQKGGGTGGEGTSQREKRPPKPDEMESYESLVRSTGY